MFSTKTGAAKLLIGVVIGLILLKAVIAWLTGSISVAAQATDSLLDLVAGIVTLLAIRIATKPADEEHPYGHGKVEEIGGVVQGILIFIAGGLIIYSAVRRIVEGATIELPEAGIGIMGISIIVSILLSRHLIKVARNTGSIALESNAHNIAADVYSASAVLIGLLIVRFTNLNYIDSIIAIGVAIIIFAIAWRTIYKSFSGLVDTRLSPEQETIIRNCLEVYKNQVAGFHELRTRRAGSQRYIDLHLVIDKEISLEQAHEICDQIETEIKDRLLEASVTIHIEPCDDKCEQCSAICSRRQSE
jgi:cation diffusion facilitator family transporter